MVIIYHTCPLEKLMRISHYFIIVIVTIFKTHGKYYSKGKYWRSLFKKSQRKYHLQSNPWQKL